MYRLITDADDRVERPQNPRTNANIFEIVTFSWLFNLFKTGKHRDLEENDLYANLNDHSSSLLGNKLEKAWRLEVINATKEQRDPSLLRTLIKIYGAEYMYIGLELFLIEIFVKILRCILIGELLNYFKPEGSNKTSTEYAYICTSCLVVCMFSSFILFHHHFVDALNLGMKMRVACSSLIYRKAIRLSNAAFGDTTVGNVNNLISNDANKLDTVLRFIHFVWVGPLQLILVTYILWQEIGVSSLFGISTFLLLIPLQVWYGKRMSKLRSKIVHKTDERVNLMNEIISGIQLIKMYTWEKSFAKLIEYVRKKEMQYASSSLYLKVLMAAMPLIQTRVQLFITVFSFVLLGNNISVKKMFYILSFYIVLGNGMVMGCTRGIMNIAELLVSVERIQKFLLLEEKIDVETLSNGEGELIIPDDEYTKTKTIDSEINTEILKNSEIVISNVTAKWTRDQTNNSLENINLTVKSAQLTAVIGPIGAGKSSLLQAIIRELPISEGSISVIGAISFASQEPWLFSGSVKQNILFDSPMNKERYKQVIDVCALKSDIEHLPHGDRSLVGEKGIILSGGQRARISLARALYKQADIYLLDDPLSAVDTKVGNHLFEKCIKGYLKDKTCILVTHQIQYLTKVDEIVVMSGACILTKGSYQEVLVSGIDFATLLESSHNYDSDIELKDKRFESNSNMSALSSNESIALSVDSRVLAKPNEEREVCTSGHNSRSIYTSYFSAGGSIFKVNFMFLMYFISQIIFTGGDYWISQWVTEEEYDLNHRTDSVFINNKTSLVHESFNTTMPSLNKQQIFVTVYMFLIMSLVLSVFINNAMFVSICTNSSIHLHNRMFDSIIKATMYFFHSNPSGRVLNRFSKDIEAVDNLLPTVLIEFMKTCFIVLQVIFVITLANTYLMIPTFIVAWLFYYIIDFYLKTSQSIKRLEGVARSPIFSHINESLRGLTIIRVYKAQRIIIEEFDKYQDLHSSAWYLFFSSSSAFGFWVDFICLTYITIVLFSFFTVDHYTNRGLIGLAITQTMRLVGLFQWVLKHFAALQVEITSVERILEYVNSPREDYPQYPLDKALPNDWPSLGEIVFHNLNLRYSSNGSSVLKNLNFHIKSMEKVGIVGRTGAGKSSIVKALFRLAINEGSIIVDGTDIHELPLQELRSKLSIIPQEPVLFSGTMRKNLDPFDEYSDHILWDALDRVELKVSVENLPGALNSKMSENGSNFSVGERQLLCLARAIVRNNKILVLDEATANVDTQTDILIQKSIRNIFRNCTVLTIAHRLNTVMDSDRVLVMDAGRVVEFDHPYNLLQNKDGFFYSMVKETGSDTAESLHAVAAKSFETKQLEKDSSIESVDGE